MLRTVAIVEDNDLEAELLKKYFSRYSREHKYTFKTVRFKSAEQFLNKYSPVYDMVFMDIGLPGINGMEAAAGLRKLDDSVMIIFVTSLARFAVQGYEVGAFDFLVKPVSYSNFVLKMQRALNKLNLRKDTDIMVSSGGDIFCISTGQLQYVEISGHKLIYHMADRTIHAYGNLKKVESALDPNRFVRCNNCYLVNLSFVQAVRGYTAVVGGHELQISRPRRKDFVQALNKFLGGSI